VAETVGRRFDLRHYVSEAFGTFVLVALGPGAAIVSAKTHAFGQSGIALAFGLAVTLVIVATGHLGGAHINPAVTIGLWSVRQFPGRQVLPYVASQCLGAVLASASLLWILGPDGGFGATTPALPIPQSFAVEAGYSAILGFVILGATDTRNAKTVVPFAIGATVCAGALVTGPLTGGSFNPARSLGPAVIGGVWTAHWLYWAAPILGMIVAMRLYESLRSAGEG
jgi:MIP family channel proteins